MVDFLRRSWAVVDLDCIDYNIRSIKQKLKPGCMIMGVVKADAYGHGDKYIADELVRLGVNWFAVSNLTEAMSLRNQGIYHPILILGTTPPNKAKQLCEYNITQAVFSLEYAKKLQQQAQRAGVTVACHIKVDTGMGRRTWIPRWKRSHRSASIPICAVMVFLPTFPVRMNITMIRLTIPVSSMSVS